MFKLNLLFHFSNPTLATVFKTHIYIIKGIWLRLSGAQCAKYKCATKG